MAGVLRRSGFELFEWPEDWAQFSNGFLTTEGTEGTEEERLRRSRRNSERSSPVSFHSM